jgi:hypothetical protein
MHLEKCAVAAAEFAKGMERFDDTGALGPAAARAGSECDDGDLAITEGCGAELG